MKLKKKNRQEFTNGNRTELSALKFTSERIGRVPEFANGKENKLEFTNKNREELSVLKFTRERIECFEICL